MNKKVLSANIIIVAKEKFQKDGYYKTDVEDIIAAANISEDDFYQHFESKEDCCNKVLKSYSQNLKKEFKEYEENLNARQRLSLHLDTYYENAEEVAKEGDAVLNLYYDLRNSGDELTKAAEDILKIQHNWIDEQFVIMFKSESATDQGDRLMAALNGLLLLANLRNDPALLKSQLIQLKSWIRSM